MESLIEAVGPLDMAHLFGMQSFADRLQGIKTDFALSKANRRALDLAAYLLVNWKLANDLEKWNAIAMNLKQSLTRNV
jgi:hypothetical protein